MDHSLETNLSGEVDLSQLPVVAWTLTQTFEGEGDSSFLSNYLRGLGSVWTGLADLSSNETVAVQLATAISGEGDASFANANVSVPLQTALSGESDFSVAGANTHSLVSSFTGISNFGQSIVVTKRILPQPVIQPAPVANTLRMPPMQPSGINYSVRRN